MKDALNPPDYATLLGLLQHYSPTGQESPAVAYLVGRMQALGFGRAFVDAAGNAVGVMGSGPRQVVLLGHIDTVPGEIPVQLVRDKASGRDLLFGRGAVDAKGPLAAFTDAAAGVRALPGWQFIVIGAVGEEGDSNGARFIQHQYRPEYAIIGEPSGWERVTLGYKGSAWAEVSVRLPQMHSAGKTPSACECAFNTWIAIGDWVRIFNSGRERAFDQILPTLRGFESGEDGFEMWARLRVGARLPLDMTPQDWYSRLVEISNAIETSRVSITPTGYAIPAYLCEKNTPLVRAFLAGIRAVGGKPGFVLKTGTADLNIVAPVWGCPAVAYGPGDSALDHTPIEHIALQEYAAGVQALRAALLRLCLPVIEG